MKFITTLFFFVGATLGMAGCDTQTDIVLPDPPTPSFTITPKTDGINTFVLKSTTPNAFLYQWDLGGGTTLDGKSVASEAEVIVYYPNKGTYAVKLSAWGKGGSAATTQSLSVAQDDPNACRGNIKLLTNCGERTWKLANEAGAMVVGPDQTAVWWGNSADDLKVRACHFNDEYTFTSKGEFRYNNKGDFWADTDGQGVVIPADLGAPAGCQPSSVWPAKYKVWDSGTHQFTISDNTLQVKGNGAWIGLYKVGEAGEVTTPSASVTFTIQSITANRMVIYKQYSWGVWKFTLVAQ